MASDDKAAELARQRFYIDTEFIESGPHRSIELISIGIVCEDGREFYAENWECPWDDANEWVKVNVYPHLKGGAITLAAIREGILKFVGDAKPEFWGYYADYDWVVFCQIFGAMVDLPKGWPMYCRDIKQLCHSLGNPILPEQTSTEHNAINDARWNRDAHAALLRPHLSASDVILKERLKKLSFLITGNDYAFFAVNPQIEESLKVYVEEARSAEASAGDVSAERERCARIIEKAFSGVGGSSIADRIRRGEK